MRRLQISSMLERMMRHIRSLDRGGTSGTDHAAARGGESELSGAAPPTLLKPPSIQASSEEPELLPPAWELHIAVLELSPAVLGAHGFSREERAAAEDRLQILISCLPPPASTWQSAPRKSVTADQWTSEECEVLRQLSELPTADGLADAEAFAWRMLQIDSVRPRLEAFRFLQFGWGSAFAHQMANLATVRGACDELMQSATTADGTLASLLAQVLALGNALNEGHRVYGGADGFALESLLELGRCPPHPCACGSTLTSLTHHIDADPGPCPSPQVLRDAARQSELGRRDPAPLPRGAHLGAPPLPALRVYHDAHGAPCHGARVHDQAATRV